jgi:sec-independent protein translocase protein TatA
MGPLGFTEILIIAGIIILLFGAKKIPELMKGLGKGMREFKEAKESVHEEMERGLRDKENPPVTLATSGKTI